MDLFDTALQIQVPTVHFTLIIISRLKPAPPQTDAFEFESDSLVLLMIYSPVYIVP